VFVCVCHRDPLIEYRSMQEFFTRALKDGARLIHDDPAVLVSPCDGTVTSMSTAASTEGMIEQVKGISYPGDGANIPVCDCLLCFFEWCVAACVY